MLHDCAPVQSKSTISSEFVAWQEESIRDPAHPTLDPAATVPSGVPNDANVTSAILCSAGHPSVSCLRTWARQKEEGGERILEDELFDFCKNEKWGGKENI